MNNKSKEYKLLRQKMYISLQNSAVGSSPVISDLRKVRILGGKNE